MQQTTRTARIEGLMSIEVILNASNGASAADLREKITDAIKQALYDLEGVDGEPYADEYQPLTVNFED